MALIENPASRWIDSLIGLITDVQKKVADDLLTAEQAEKIFYAQVAASICKDSLTLAQVNEWIDMIALVKKRTGGDVPFWLHRVDDTEFLQLQLLGECAPVGAVMPVQVDTAQQTTLALAAQRRSWLLVGGAAVAGALMVGAAVWAMRPTKAIRRRKRR